MGGGGSGGGGTSTTQAHAEYPEEFRPLAEAAVKQIIALQGRLPLESFGEAQTARVAGLSPFTQAGMSLVPSLMLRSPAEQQLGQVPNTLGDLLGQFGPVMQPTNAAQGALGFLGGQIGRNLQLAPSMWQPPRLPQAAPTPTAFQGFNAPLMPQGGAPQGGGVGGDMSGILEAPPLMSLQTPLPLQTQFDQFVAQQQTQLAALQAAQQQAISGPLLPPGLVLGPNGEIVSNPYSYELGPGGVWGPPTPWPSP